MNGGVHERQGVKASGTYRPGGLRVKAIKGPMHDVAHNAIANVQAGRPVVCTIEEYYSTVRATLQRYAIDQAARGNPDGLTCAHGEIRRLDAAQASGYWPGSYGSVWEWLFVLLCRRYATRTLSRHYYQQAQGLASSP